MNRIIYFLTWVVFLFGILSICYDLINKSSTIGNIAGVIILIVFALVSVKTKCFTSVITKFKSK